jgi:malate permease and related proteins
MAIGQIALPLALLGIGASLTFKGLFNDFSNSLFSALIKTIATPIFGFFVGSVIGLPRQELMIVLLYLACPTAVASYVMAQQMDADEILAGKIVIFSVFFSMAGFSLILALF